jgi:amidase
VGEKRGEGRREFLKQGAIGTVAAAAAGMGSTSRAGARVTPREEAARADGRVEVRSFELDEITFGELQDGMKSGKFTARSITEKYLARIAEIDASGPTLRSVIETNPDALQIADEMDKERAAKGPRGPLHGIPILIKDNIDTADKMMTTAGSLALVGAKPAKDSFVAQKLREAGAVILGKTNPSEWANIRSSHATSGWSGRGGLTKNPYALDRNPCGSSSGSGAAASANLAAGTIGTETDGSIVCPSSANGIVGIKPTVGLISRSGIIPISHSQDSAGPMCRTVRDAAILLGALTGVDPDDHATDQSSTPGHAFADYTKFLDPAGLKGARIGVVRKFFGFNDFVDALMEQAIDLMKREGAIVVDPADIAMSANAGALEFTALLYELKADLNAYLARLGADAPVKSLADVIAFNEKHRDKEMPYFGQDTFLKAQAKGGLTNQEYVDAVKDLLTIGRTDGIDATMNKLNLDALVAPTGGPAWVTDLINGDNSTGQTSTAAAIARYPSISVPGGTVFGLPVGISFFGRGWSEGTLIKIAYAFEQASKVRKTPRFLETVDLGMT